MLDDDDDVENVPPIVDAGAQPQMVTVLSQSAVPPPRPRPRKMSMYQTDLLTMARKEHEQKMIVLKLKEALLRKKLDKL